MLRRLLRAALRVTLLLLFVGVALAAWALGEPAVLVIEEATVTPAGWDAPPLRVALLSDLHVGSPWNDLDRLQAIVERTNALSPDLVLLLGDYAINDIPGGHPLPEAAWTAVLGGLEAKRGVYAVLGNHDWWNDEDTIRAAFEANGIPVLENRAVSLGKGVWLAGIGDSFTGHDRVKKALTGVPAGASVLAMTHGPDVFDDPALRADLLVAGHTHGGQVVFPFVGAPAVPEGYLRGPYTRGERHLWVTSGIGTSVLPVRFGVPPEIVILTVRSGGKGAMVDAGR